MRLIRALTAGLTLLALIAGVPVLLLRLIGNPIDGLTGLFSGDVTDQVVVSVLTVIACAAAIVGWAQFVVAFVVELVSGIRRDRVPARIPFVFQAQQHLARTLVTAALLLGSTVLTTIGPTVTATAATPTATTATAATAAPVRWAPAWTPVSDDTMPTAADVTAATPPSAGGGGGVVVVTVPTRSVVIAPDGPRTWWDLAEQYLGAGDQWHTLWDLNQNHTQPDGTVLTAPTTVLRPGWDITIPDTTVTPANADVTTTGTGVTNGTTVSSVTVEPGDTLSEIAADHGHLDWTALWDLNKDRPEPDGRTFTDPNLIRPGWIIAVSTTDTGAGADSAAQVTVLAGDTLSEIAAEYHTSTGALWAANEDREQPGGQIFTDPDHIEPGWTLTLPAPAGPADQAPPATQDAEAGTDDSVDLPGSGATASDTTPPDSDAPELSSGSDAGGEDQSGTETPAQADQSVIDDAAGSDEVGDQFTAPENGEPSATAPAPAGAPGPAVDAGTGGENQVTGASTSAAIAAPDTIPAQTTGDELGDTAGAAAGAAITASPADDTAVIAVPPPSPGTTGTPTPSDTPATASTTASAVSQTTGAATNSPGTEAATATENTNDAADESATLSMLAAGGGAVLLTGLALGALIRARRRQFRLRRPGRAVPTTPGGAATMERLINTTGERGFADLERLDHALRGLVHTLAQHPDGVLPDVIAARTDTTSIELILATPSTTAPQPWTVDDAGNRWLLKASAELGYDAAERDGHMPPFPLLVSVGYTPDGDHWLLDLERVGTLRIVGDPERARNLARYIAAEIGMNTWSELLQVTLVGTGTELAGLNPAQITHTRDLPAVAAKMRAHLRGVDQVATEAGVDVSGGRLHGIAGDTWAPHLIIVDTDSQPEPDVTALLNELTDDRQPVAVVLAGGTEPSPAARWTLTVDDLGVLTVPDLELQLIAEQLPADEAAPLAQLLEAAARDIDQAVPDAPGDAGWEQLADTAGNLRTDLTTTVEKPALKVAGTWPGRANSILPLNPAVYAALAATTEEDIVALAPGVPDTIRQQAATADPDLDTDLHAWWDQDSPRVKLRLLGPVDVWAAGLDPVPVGKPQKVEAVAYLATRDRGASAAQTRQDLWPEDRSDRPTSKVRNLMLGCRTWLGVNPATGREHLPPNAGEDRGGLYNVEGILTDADLFRRLRVRALTRGPQGITDLRSALDLVRGMPFEAHRPRGYGWNTDLVAHYVGMIADTAHIVATHHLANNEPEPAAAAAQVALKAGSTADNVLLDLVAACHARGDHLQGDTYVHRIMTNWGADVEEEIPARTYAILLRRGWLPRRSA